MSKEALDSQARAQAIIADLKAQADELRREKVDAIAERWVETGAGRCRVAVCNSPYGIHFEIGPLHGSDDRPTQVFSGSDEAKAIALLAGYYEAEMRRTAADA